MQFVTVEQVKQHLEKADEKQDALIKLIIEQISASMEAFINRNLEKTARVEKFDGGETLYYLRAFPIDLGETFTITEDGTAQTIDDDFYVYPEEGMIEFVNETSDAKPRIMEFTWTGGYTATNGVLNVPDDLKRACLIQSVFEFRHRKNVGISSTTSPDGTVGNIKEVSNFLPGVLKILKSNRVNNPL